MNIKKLMILLASVLVGIAASIAAYFLSKMLFFAPFQVVSVGDAYVDYFAYSVPNIISFIAASLVFIVVFIGFSDFLDRRLKSWLFDVKHRK